MWSIFISIALSIILASCSRPMDVDKAFESVNLGNGNSSTSQIVNRGIFDASIAWLGAGNYTGIDATKIPSGNNLCDGLTVLGVQGTAICQSGTATDAGSNSHVLMGKEYWDENGVLQVGTMPERTLSNLNSTVQAGYYDADDLTAIDTDLAPGNIKVGTDMFGVTGTFTSDADAVAGDMLSGKTAYVNGNKVTGSIATQTLSNASTAVPAGYYALTDLATVDSDLVASNIKSGTNIFGVSGTAIVQSGTATDPAATGNVLFGKEYWNSTGSKQTGTMPNQGGLWDLGDAFPGAGYYSAIHPSQTLSTSDVCSTKNFLGNPGQAICQSASAGTNATSSQVLEGTYYWNSTGQSIEGTMANRGAWNLTQSFPGVGYYTGSSNAPASSQICSSATFLGSAGTATCQSGTATDAASTANVLSGKEYWDGTGTKQTGSMTDQGSSWDLTIAFPGAGYYSGINPSLSSSQVCSSATFLGSSGSAVCLSGTATSPASQSDVLSGKEYWDSTGTKQTGTGNFDWNTQIYSMAPRSDLATAPTSSSNRSIATLSQEVSNGSAFSNNYNLIPNPKFDTEGRYGTASGTAQRHYLVTITGRPNTTCGTSGSIETRISDCVTQNGNKAFYDGKNYGQSGEGDWKLVTRTSDGYEVWRDERTKLLWSDRMSTTYNWYRATGYASTDSTTANTGGYDARPGSGTGCSGAPCQSNPPESVCVDASLISTLSGYSAFTTPSGEDVRKGNLTFTSSPSVTWRLPTMEDWKLAEVNGIRKVLPNMDYHFWSATSYSNFLASAWFFYGLNSYIYYSGRHTEYSVRCVGR
ncbi:MAG: hypothetical protein ACKN9V_07645 [Pseudomonadota bacterium]